MVEREFTETVDTAEDIGTIVSKVCGRFFVTTGGVTLVGRGGKNPKGGLHGTGGINDMVHRSVVLMVAGGNTS